MLKIFSSVFIGLALYFPAIVFAHSQTQIIEMTQNGFDPQEVSIDANSSVIFVNRDTQSRWPASNTHPTHDLYPEFDPRQPIKPGDSWAFKPKKAGSWKYHDHLFPHKRGILVVSKEEGEEKNTIEQAKTELQAQNNLLGSLKQFLQNIVTKIKNVFKKDSFDTKRKYVFKVEEFKKANYKMQGEIITNIAKESSAESAWENIRQAYNGEAGSEGRIHDLAHLAGNLLHDEKGLAGLNTCSSEFAFGCYHGFLDKEFAKNLDNLEKAHNACLGLGNDTSGPVASCIHGIGHGIASYYLTSDIKKSLSACRRLTTGQEYCFDGVFMEFVRSASNSFFRKDDPLYPCNQLEKDFGYAYSFSCGRNQPSLLMGRFKVPFEDVASLCVSATSKPFKEGCVEALGFSLASTKEVEKIIGGCQTLGSQFANTCIEKAAGELVFQDVPGWEEKTKTLCESIVEKADECHGYVQRLVSEYGKKRKINFVPLKKNEDPNSYIKRQLAICYEMEGRDSCYQQAANVLYSQLGLTRTLSLLKNNESYPQVYARCHEVTHYLSRLEYDRQKNVAKVYTMCDSTCHGGCYHGTMEAYLKEYESKAEANLNAQFSKICGDKQTYQKPLEFYECLHGLGHAGMFITDMDLPLSLTLCETLQFADQKERCYTGVFMENSSSSTSFDHKSKYVKADDPFYPCNSLDKKYQAICWQYQSSYFSIINNQNWTKVAQMCLKIPEEYQVRCFRTIGTNQVGFTSSLEIMKNNCDLMPTDNFQDVCVAGVISSLSYRFVGDSKKMFSFCSMVSQNHKETCYKQIGTSMLDWNKDRVLAQKECDKSEDVQGKSWCMNTLQ